MGDKRFVYNVYGKGLISNVRMPLLEGASAPPEGGVELFVTIDKTYNRNAHDIRIYPQGQSYMALLGRLAQYTIYPDQNKVLCTAISHEAMFSTLFNIPYSVYLAAKGELLLHACTMLYKERAICFVGDKGTGKSTLTGLLNSDELILIADDTVRIDKQNMVYRAHNLVKFTPESMEIIHNRHVLQHKNIAGKSYVKIDTPFISAQIGMVVQLARSNDGIRLTDIHDMMAKRRIYIGNVVGLQYFPAELICKAMRFGWSNIFFCKLHIPGTLLRLVAGTAQIRDTIKQSLDRET
nr:hypothetical protein [bacterium]